MIDMKQRIEETLAAALNQAEVHVIDPSGDGSHIKVTVTSPDFANRSLIQQHRLVYDALQDYFKQEIHAMTLVTKVPA